MHDLKQINKVRDNVHGCFLMTHELVGFKLINCVICKDNSQVYDCRKKELQTPSWLARLRKIKTRHHEIAVITATQSIHSTMLDVNNLLTGVFHQKRQ